MARGRDIGDALEAAVDTPDPVPTTGPALIRYAGGRQALVRDLSGMSGPPRRGDYAGDELGFKAASTRWRSASRRVQRWSDEGKAGKQSRGHKRATLSEDQRGRVQTRNVDRKWSRFVRDGIHARMTATVVVPSSGARGVSDTRVRTMPAGGEAVLIPADKADEILAELEADPDRAAGLFREAFFDAYGMPDDAEIRDVSGLTIWPGGEAEPV